MQNKLQCWYKVYVITEVIMSKKKKVIIGVVVVVIIAAAAAGGFLWWKNKGTDVGSETLGIYAQRVGDGK